MKFLIILLVLLMSCSSSELDELKKKVDFNQKEIDDLVERKLVLKCQKVNSKEIHSPLDFATAPICPVGGPDPCHPEEDSSASDLESLESVYGDTEEGDLGTETVPLVEKKKKEESIFLICHPTSFEKGTEK